MMVSEFEIVSLSANTQSILQRYLFTTLTTLVFVRFRWSPVPPSELLSLNLFYFVFGICLSVGQHETSLACLALRRLPRDTQILRELIG